ncbi:copper resistance D family protein [Nocardioides marinisabuli]|uniref:copper resistance D family protein n=1 Tax=Nocardioides marinisabuli TaxID=419476 RepID=UPI0015DD6E1C|nr:cytochrome c oxidase assembly protein [Nocardioides marinisabuli]
MSTRARPRATSTHRSVLPGVVGTSVAVAVVAMVLAGGGPEEVPPGLSDPGPLVGWGVRLARLASDLAAIATVGSLLLTVALLPGRPVGRAVRSSAACWSLAAAATWFLTMSEASGVAPRDLDVATVSRVVGTPQVSAAASVALLAAALAVAGGRLRGRWEGRGLLGVALGAALAMPLTGHVAGGEPGSQAATSALLVHVLAAVLWVGGLAALVLHLRGDPAGLSVAAPRFSRLALGAFVALAGGGAVSAAGVLGPPGPDWLSGYAAVVAAKVGVLGVLGAAGHLHRRRTLPRLGRGEPGAFAALASAELAWMGAAAGLAVALSRTPPPSALAPSADDHVASSTPPVLSVPGVLTQARPDVLVVTVLAAALVWYVAAARSASTRTGARWPARRTVAFVAGLLVVFMVLCSGLAAWAPVLLSVHLGSLVVLLVVAPTLLLAGRPLTLARGRARAPAPLVGASIACAAVLLVQVGPVLETSLRSSAGRLVAAALALAIGLALWRRCSTRGPVQGGRPTRSVPSVWSRSVWACWPSGSRSATASWPPTGSWSCGWAGRTRCGTSASPASWWPRPRGGSCSWGPRRRSGAPTATALRSRCRTPAARAAPAPGPPGPPP